QRIGLVGCGIISSAHLDGWQSLAEVARVEAVCDVDPERARQAAEKLGGARVYTDYHQLLADPALDAVDLCLPHHLHRPVTEEALAAGKHVLCQKPIATTLADADAMLAAAERAGRVLAVAELSRFNPAVAKTRELLDEGVVGQPILVQSVMPWYQGGAYMQTAWRFAVDTMGGGALIDGGIHHVDLLLALLGRPLWVSCATRRVRDIFPAEDTAVVTGEFEGGVLATLTVLWSARHTPGVLLRVCGTEGTLTAEHGVVRVASDRLPDQTAEHTLPQLNGFGALMRDFVECTETGRRPRMGGPEARADLSFVLAAYESARTGRVVVVE
ncbi:MAG: Gfo/Idh/MocA family oxidoreductase, partial [Armatimonadetes bacterium]|nr:Gfo/Idh/MocA family oxidoreductase [Armatimonadota bacterium]